MTIKESQMRKFDIDEALNDALVCTKNGDIVTQITVFDGVYSDFCIAGVLDGSIETWDKCGLFFQDCEKSVNNLMLYEEEKSDQQWINVFTLANKEQVTSRCVFDSKESAKEFAHDNFLAKSRQVRIDNV